MPPFALKTQLYSILKDRTLVDRQLDELRRAACREGRGPGLLRPGRGGRVGARVIICLRAPGQDKSPPASDPNVRLHLLLPRRLSNQLRLFQLPTGTDDFALMLAQDYADALEVGSWGQAAL